MPDMTTDFAQIQSDISAVETTGGQIDDLLARMTATGGSFAAFQADFTDLLALVAQLKAQLVPAVAPTPPPAPAP